MKGNESVELLRKASKELKLSLHYYKINDMAKAAEHLVKMRSYWSPATINEFLADEL
jgi:hypothetical protein